jgi:calcineurin-like phosphoesterase family protein
MSGSIFFASDHHLFQENILKFLDDNGKRIRWQFDTLDQMHEHIIEKHNSVVKPGDKVYFMGDVTFKYHEPFNAVMRRLNGKKRLLIGNHDKLNPTLMMHFEKVLLWRVFKEFGFIATHVPIHYESFRHKCTHNVHGHVHVRPVPHPEWPGKLDPRYINMSMEAIDYTPKSVEEIQGMMK